MLATFLDERETESSGKEPRHLSLARAAREPGGAAAVGAGLQTATAASPLLRELVDNRRIFQPQPLAAAEAYRFLVEARALERAGLMLRVPDWWSAGKARPQVTVKIGGEKPRSGVGSLLDFKVELTLFGTPLTPEEWATLRKAVSGLVFLRGQWVEVDARMLEHVLGTWQKSAAMAAGHGLSFVKALRLLCGGLPPKAGKGGSLSGGEEEPAADDVRRWSAVVAGEWLEDTRRALEDPEGLARPSLAEAGVKAALRPYQEAGVAWLWRLAALGVGGCLADDMGLGKTLQILSFLAMKKAKGRARRPALVVAPATLVPTWIAEARRFTPWLKIFGAHPSQTNTIAMDESDLVVTSYGAMTRYAWLHEVVWDVVVFDEAQALKNPDTQQSGAARALQAMQKLALTGTPIENQALDLWSLFAVINPGLLGTADEFSAAEPALIQSVVKPYILRRMKTDRKIVPDLPDKTEVEVVCGLVPAQAALYERLVAELGRDLKRSEGMQKKGLILAALLKLKQVCDHPCLATRHGDFRREASGKLLRLATLAAAVAQRGERMLVFTQFREMTAVLARELAAVFGREGCVLHGETPVAERQALVEAFQRPDGPPYFILSLKAGGTGLTLTAAQHVVHFDRWWNPAVEDQATDRAYRIGQHANVLVHKFACAGTVEARIAAMLQEKRGLARAFLGAAEGAALTELADEELLRLVALDITTASLDA